MNSLFDYYRKKVNIETDTIYFERVKEEDITICGKSVSEIMKILSGLEIERVYGIEMTMKNLDEYKRIMLNEIQIKNKKMMEEVFINHFENLNLRGDKSEV